MKNTIILFGAIFVIAISCSKSNDPGTSTGVSLSFKGTTTSPAIVKGSGTDTYTFSEALMGIKEIELKKEEEQFDDNDMNFNFEGNYVVDLLAGTTSPTLGFAELTPGTYNKFESRTAQLLDGGNSISLKGTVTDGGGTLYNFEFATTSEIKFEFESDSAFVITEGTVHDMLVNINLPVIFEGIDFSKAVADDTGKILINDLSNADLSAIIKINIDHAAEMENENEHETEHKAGKK